MSPRVLGYPQYFFDALRTAILGGGAYIARFFAMYVNGNVGHPAVPFLVNAACRAQGQSRHHERAAEECPKRVPLHLYLPFVIRIHRVQSSWVRRVGRSALRPGLVSRAWEVDRPPALYLLPRESWRETSTQGLESGCRMTS